MFLPKINDPEHIGFIVPSATLLIICVIVSLLNDHYTVCRQEIILCTLKACKRPGVVLFCTFSELVSSAFQIVVQLLNLRYLVRRLEQGIAQTQGLFLHRRTQLKQRNRPWAHVLTSNLRCKAERFLKRGLCDRHV
jgi:hypothetical protein